MPRLYREAPLNGIWEGTGNMMCMDVLRGLRRDAGTAEAFMDEVDARQGRRASISTAGSCRLGAESAGSATTTATRAVSAARHGLCPAGERAARARERRTCSRPFAGPSAAWRGEPRDYGMPRRRAGAEAHHGAGHRSLRALAGRPAMARLRWKVGGRDRCREAELAARPHSRSPVLGAQGRRAANRRVNDGERAWSRRSRRQGGTASFRGRLTSHKPARDQAAWMERGGVANSAGSTSLFNNAGYQEPRVDQSPIPGDDCLRPGVPTRMRARRGSA